MMDISLLLPLILLLIGVLILLQSTRRQRDLQLPPGTTIYQDTDEEPGETLYSHELQLKGRPDFLIRRDDMIIPVEVKTGRTPRDSPYPNHMMQLIVYCVLVEAHYGVRPSHGVVRYPDQSYEVAFTQELEANLKKIVEEMQFIKQSDVVVHRNHNNPRRCVACDFRDACDEQLQTQNTLPLEF